MSNKYQEKNMKEHVRINPFQHRNGLWLRGLPNDETPDGFSVEARVDGLWMVLADFRTVADAEAAIEGAAILSVDEFGNTDQYRADHWVCFALLIQDDSACSETVEWLGPATNSREIARADALTLGHSDIVIFDYFAPLAESMEA